MCAYIKYLESRCIKRQELRLRHFAAFEVSQVEVKATPISETTRGGFRM